MNAVTLPQWSPSEYCFALPRAYSAEELKILAGAVYPLVCRTDSSQPGFCLIDLGDASSQELRKTIVAMAEALSDLHSESLGQQIAIQSAARFDQQVTTKLHRDGGPDRSLLLLGYEPSEIGSELALADYSRCAEDLGMTPREFLTRHNPMYAAEAQRLAPYTSGVACFRPGQSQLALINNSLSPAEGEGPGWLGVLHAATVPHPSAEHRRVINSVQADQFRSNHRADCRPRRSKPF